MTNHRFTHSLAAGLLAVGLTLTGAMSAHAASADSPAVPAPAAADCMPVASFTQAESETLAGLTLAVLDEADPSKTPVTINGWDTAKTGYVTAKPALVVPRIGDGAQKTLMLSVKWYDASGDQLDPNQDGPAWLSGTVKTVVAVTGLESKATRTYTVASDASLLPGETTRFCRIAVYRLFNPYMTSGTTHLFTTDQAEYDKAVKAGWRGEGIQFYAAASAANRAKSVYRLYNKWDGSHHFTVDPSERDTMVKAGWTLEETTWWAPADGDAPVYRLYNQYNGEHLFTTDKGENDKLARLGWTVEQSGFSVYSQAK